MPRTAAGKRLPRRRVWLVLALALAGLVLGGAAIAFEFTRDVAQSFSDPVRQFKYGSTGGDRLAGLPVGVFRALPEVCRKYLPGDGLKSLGFNFEAGMDRPIGTSERHSLGFNRISLNCACPRTGSISNDSSGC